MGKFVRVCSLVGGIGFMLCAGAAQAEGIKDVLSGKTLTSPKGKTVYILNSDGALGGKIAKQNVVGNWEVRDEQWCRTISEPEERAGDACRTVAIDGNHVTLGGGGQSVVYTMQ